MEVNDSGVSQALEKIITLVEETDIASIKSIVTGIVNLINDPKSNIKDLKDLIEVDPPLTARVLRLANSAYYGSPKKISEIDQAVIWIGFDALKELVLSQKVCEIFISKGDTGDYSRPKLWRHSVACALLSKMIYRREYGERGETAYAAGLLHDIGLIVSDQLFPESFTSNLETSVKEKKNLYIVEREKQEYDHTDIAKAITEHWNLPEEICNGINSHHESSKSQTGFERLAKTLYIANHLVQQNNIGFKDAPQRDEAQFEKCADEMGLKPFALDLIVKDTKNEIRKMEKQGLFE